MPLTVQHDLFIPVVEPVDRPIDPKTRKEESRTQQNKTQLGSESQLPGNFWMIPMVHPYGSSPTIRIPKPSSNPPYRTEAVVFWGGLFGMITVPVFTVWGPMI